jgi:hypothetical protein
MRFDIGGYFMIDLIDFCNTEAQKQIILLRSKGMKNKEISLKVGVHKDTVSRIITKVKRRAESRDVSQGHDLSIYTNEGFSIKAVSTLYDQKGNVKTRRVNLNQSSPPQVDLIKEIVDELKSEIPRQKPIKFESENRKENKELLNLYTITDYHLGMMAWAQETGGEDWGLDKAEKLLIDWFEKAIESSPSSDVAIFNQLGDFLHFDGLSPVTPKNKNVLDTDARYPQVVRAAIRVIRVIINKLLMAHKHVHVILAEGNHDESSSVWLRELFDALYEEEKRVTIDNSSLIYYVYQHGSTGLYFHHGHAKTTSNVDQVFVSKFNKIYGKCDHNYGHLGHRHSKIVQSNLMIVEQHETLSPMDAYAARGGWLSGRSAQVITYHKKHGEISRCRITPGALL